MLPDDLLHRVARIYALLSAMLVIQEDEGISTDGVGALNDGGAELRRNTVFERSNLRCFRSKAEDHFALAERFVRGRILYVHEIGNRFPFGDSTVGGPMRRE